MPCSRGRDKQPIEDRVGHLVLPLIVDDQGGPTGTDPGDSIAQGEDRAQLGMLRQEPKIRFAQDTQPQRWGRGLERLIHPGLADLSEPSPGDRPLSR